MAVLQELSAGMFSFQNFAKPQVKSLIGALSVAVSAMVGSWATPLLGYVFALMSLVMIIVVTLLSPAWPSQSKKENALVFSMFWGLMMGVIAPYLISKFLEGGFAAVFEILTSEP